MDTTPTAPPRWRTLPLDVADPATLLTRSTELLEGLDADPRATLRWYRPTHTAIVRGRGQRRLPLTPQRGVTEVVRDSGGGAVLLSPDVLSLDVVLPPGHPWVPAIVPGHLTDPGELFMRVGAAWHRALVSLGVPDLVVHPDPLPAAARQGQRGRLLGAVCFALPGRGEILSGGRKLVGLAQRRRRSGALVQCGMLWRWQPARLLAALDADPEDREVHRAAVGLAEALEEPPSEATVMREVQAAFELTTSEPDTVGDHGEPTDAH